jgi:LPXTG-motif cell wall-anchored protein
MKTRKIFAGAAAVAIGTLGALALTTPAQAVAMASPTVAWDAQCDAKGHVKVTFTAPPQASQADRVTVGLVGKPMTYRQLPTSTGEKTVTIDFTDVAPMTAGWFNTGSNLGPVEANAHFTWALPEKCKPTVDIVKPTCKDPYLSVTIFNPAGAQPLNVLINSSPNNLPGGESDGIVGTSKNVTWKWSSPVAGSAEGTVEYQPPAGCNADEPGAKAVPPVEGKRHHGKGHYQRPAPVANTGNNAGGGNQGGDSPNTQAAAGGQSDDSLPVTGSPVRTVLLAGAVMMIIGVVVLLVARRRRAIRFSVNG